MKNRFLAFMVLGLVIITLQSVFASEIKYSANNKAFDKIYDEINKMSDEYAGAYYDKNGILHIIPCIAVPLTKNGDYTSLGVIYDEPVQYSLRELKDAYEILSDNAEELELTAYGKNVMENCLDVYAVEWTEDEKKKVIELTGISKVNFYIDKDAANWVIDYGYVPPRNSEIKSDYTEDNNLIPSIYNLLFVFLFV